MKSRGLYHGIGAAASDGADAEITVGSQRIGINIAALRDAGSKDGGTTAQATEGEAEFAAQFIEILTTPILEFDALEMVPHALVGVEVGCRGRQAFRTQSRRRTASLEVPDRLTAMEGRTIPHRAVRS